jgi:hypothetical protein
MERSSEREGESTKLNGGERIKVRERGSGE